MRARPGRFSPRHPDRAFTSVGPPGVFLPAGASWCRGRPGRGTARELLERSGRPSSGAEILAMMTPGKLLPIAALAPAVAQSAPPPPPYRPPPPPDDDAGGPPPPSAQADSDIPAAGQDVADEQVF